MTELTPGKPLTKLYQGRVRNKQDLIVIVDDHHNRRGTGKTTLSLGLAEAFDRTEEGLTPDKCTLTPQGLIDGYIDHPKGSALVLDEAEAGLSKYRAGSHTNLAIRQLISMGRIEEKYVVFNLPSSAEMDRDLKALCDVWVMVEKKGLATVHFLGWNPYKGHPLTPIKQQIRWSNITNERIREIYEQLADEKEAYLRGESEESQLINAKQHQKTVKAERENAETETRNKLIREFYDNSDLTQQQIADSVGLSRSRVADIVTS